MARIGYPRTTKTEPGLNVGGPNLRLNQELSDRIQPSVSNLRL